VDIIFDSEKNVLVGGIMEHVEQAGVHSGDSGCSLPPFSLSKDIQEELVRQVVKLAEHLNVIGLMNTQFAIQNNIIYILEVNPRASRTIPFVSKSIGIPLAKIAARVMVGESLKQQGYTSKRVPPYFSVKEAVFPFIKFSGADPILGPEMKSTGEVMGTGRTFGEAYAKAQLASGVILPVKGTALLSVRDRDKEDAARLATILSSQGFNLVGTHGTAKSLNQSGIKCDRVNKVREGRPHIVDMIKNGEIDLIVNTTEGKQAIEESLSIRSAAVRKHITYYTTIGAAIATCTAIEHIGDSSVNCLQDLHSEVFL
jgi:carbamoyl-phosphate synthase large subunit